MDFTTLAADDSYLADLGNGVWLMDDHRWALKVWETEGRHDHYALIHADSHWNACYDFFDHPEEEAELLSATPGQVAAMVKAGNLVRRDSFIAPAIRRGLVETIHLYGPKDDATDAAFDAGFLRSCNAALSVYQLPQQLAVASIAGPLIFDLCLDLFKRTEVQPTGDIGWEHEIHSFLDATRHWVAAADLVTVAMSFDRDGSAERTQQLTKLVVPRMLSFRTPKR